MREEKRRHLRLPVQSKVFIELISAAAGSGERAEMAICRTIDLSRGGLRVSLEKELVVGAIHQIGVELAEVDSTLYLAGEVKWCLPDAGPEKTWSAGFEVLNAANSDIERWVALLRSKNG